MERFINYKSLQNLQSVNETEQQLPPLKQSVADHFYRSPAKNQKYKRLADHATNLTTSLFVTSTNETGSVEKTVETWEKVIKVAREAIGLLYELAEVDKGIRDEDGDI